MTKRHYLFALLFGSLLLVCTLSINMSGIKSSSSELLISERWHFQIDEAIVSDIFPVAENIIVRSAEQIIFLNSLNGEVVQVIDSLAFAPDDAFNGDRLILGNSNFLVAVEQSNSLSVYSSDDGELAWRLPANTNFISDLEQYGDILLVVRHDDGLTAYHLPTGKTLWHVSIPPRTSLGIAVNSESVYLQAGEFLRIYDLREGILVTEKKFDGITGELILNNNILFVTFARNGNWYVNSIRSDTLGDIWMVDLGKISHPYINVIDGNLYIYNKSLMVIETVRGIVVWQDDTRQLYSSPALHNDDLFFLFICRAVQ